MKKTLLAGLTCAAIAMWVGTTNAQDHGHGHGHDHDHDHKGHDHGQHDHEGHDHGGEADGMMPEFQMPEAAHQVFAGMAGNWTVQQSMWMGPGSEPMVTPANEKVEIILNGLGVSYAYESAPFSGYGFTVWNSDKKAYQNYWVDNVKGSPVVEYFTTYDAKTKTMTGTMDSPQGKMKIVNQLESKNSHTMTFYMQMPDGTEFKNMELKYTRAS